MVPALSRGIVTQTPAVLYKAGVTKVTCISVLNILLPSLRTHQGRDGPEGTIWSTRTQRTYRKTWKTRQTSRTMVFPVPVTPGVCVVVEYDCAVICGLCS